MSAPINDGGPAFPLEQGTGDYYTREQGMTLRDYFAGRALIGVFAGQSYDWHDEHVAKRCYQMADAMLKAREPK